jgi:nicotinate-nucleotide--dimethylbenzimidazole phosphoribosyltransferase
MNFIIQAPNQTIFEQLKHKIDFKTKPLGALGRLEELALQLGLIQQSTTPALNNPHILVFAADHGLAAEGISAYPQEVTWQMVVNFLNEGAAINVFCNQNKIQLQVIDAGVNHHFEENNRLLNRKIGLGTANSLKEPAMTQLQVETALQQGALIVQNAFNNGCNTIGFGEMGIGNTSAAAMLMSVLLDLPISECVGRGTGLTDEGLIQKQQILERVLEKHKNNIQSPIDALQYIGGFEIAMITGAILKAAELKMIILVDGFIASAAYLVAYKLYSECKHYAIFCHQSNEHGHSLLLQHLQAAPLLNLGMRLGEGTGCAIAYPIIESAVSFLNKMASFESAGVSNN